MFLLIAIIARNLIDYRTFLDYFLIYIDRVLLLSIASRTLEIDVVQTKFQSENKNKRTNKKNKIKEKRKQNQIVIISNVTDWRLASLKI